MPVVKLTDSFITNDLHCPDNKGRIEWCDKDVSGLYVEVRETMPGHGTYYLRYKNASKKTSHQKIGRTADVSLADARKQAKLLKAEIACGSDPRGDVKAKKAVSTFTDFFNDHYMPHAMARKRSWKRDDELFRLRIQGVFGHKRLNEISRQQIQTFHASVLKEGLAPATADHHVKLIRRCFNLAIEWSMIDKNPAARIEQFNVDNKVENYMNDEELERLLTVLRANDPSNVCQVAMFLLSTGARLNEALQARWDQVDKQTRVWRIPARNSKSKRIRSIPLNDSALEILGQLETEGKHDYLFINRRTKKPLTSVNRVWSDLRIKAGLPKLRLHDLRHQYASFLVNSGRTLYEVQQILGHSDAKVTVRYAHLSSKTLQDAANSASMAIKRSGSQVM